MADHAINEAVVSSRRADALPDGRASRVRRHGARLRHVVGSCLGAAVLVSIGGALRCRRSRVLSPGRPSGGSTPFLDTLHTVTNIAMHRAWTTET